MLHDGTCRAVGLETSLTRACGVTVLLWGCPRSCHLRCEPWKWAHPWGASPLGRGPGSPRVYPARPLAGPQGENPAAPRTARLQTQSRRPHRGVGAAWVTDARQSLDSVCSRASTVTAVSLLRFVNSHAQKGGASPLPCSRRAGHDTDGRSAPTLPHGSRLQTRGRWRHPGPGGSSLLCGTWRGSRLHHGPPQQGKQQNGALLANCRVLTLLSHHRRTLSRGLTSCVRTRMSTFRVAAGTGWQVTCIGAHPKKR